MTTHREADERVLLHAVATHVPAAHFARRDGTGQLHVDGGTSIRPLVPHGLDRCHRRVTCVRAVRRYGADRVPRRQEAVFKEDIGCAF